MKVIEHLDEERCTKLERVPSLTHFGADEILCGGIDFVEQRAKRSVGRRVTILSSGFVGCLHDAPEHLVANHRQDRIAGRVR